MKPILCLDFDGVLHSYTSGWKRADQCPDPPVLGSMGFLADASEVFEIHIFSSRSNQPGGIEAMMTWLRHYVKSQFGHIPAWYNQIQWPTEKPPAFITIDDRAILFEGTFPNPVDLLTFKPWNKR